MADNLTNAIEDKPEEKTEFGLILKSVGAKKIEVIKVIRQFTTLGLKEAKELSETKEPTVISGVSKEIVEDAKNRFELVGAVVEIV